MISKRKLKKIYRKTKKLKNLMVEELCHNTNCTLCFFLEKSHCKGLMALDEIDDIVKKEIIDKN